MEASLGVCRRWLFLLDVLVAVAVGAAASAARYGSLEGWARMAPGAGPGWALAGFAAAWAGCLALAGAYHRHRFLGRREEARRVAWAGVALLAFLAGFLYFTHNVRVSRALAPALALGVTAVTVAGRAAGRALLARARRSGYNRCRVLIVGTGDEACRFAAAVTARPELGVEVVGFLDGGRASVCGFPVLGEVREIRRVLTEQVVDEVIVAQPGASRDLLEEVLTACAAEGKVAHVAADALAIGSARCAAGSVAGLPVLSFATGPRESLSLAAKRLLDVAGALAGLVALAPLLVVIALAIRLDSPGPVLFVQERVGLHGRRFRLYKFRSMVADAERRLAEVAHLNEMEGPVFKVRRDPRVTRVGRFLRRTSLDELPQLWNVLRGEMSLVGPRPPLPREVAHYGPRERRRLSVKPGLTCLWQVSGRNDVPFDRWVDLDLEYIDRWNLWLDLKILLRTVPQVLGMTGV